MFAAAFASSGNESNWENVKKGEEKEYIEPGAGERVSSCSIGSLAISVVCCLSSPSRCLSSSSVAATLVLTLTEASSGRVHEGQQPLLVERGVSKEDVRDSLLCLCISFSS